MIDGRPCEHIAIIDNTAACFHETGTFDQNELDRAFHRAGGAGSWGFAELVGVGDYPFCAFTRQPKMTYLGGCSTLEEAVKQRDFLRIDRGLG